MTSELWRGDVRTGVTAWAGRSAQAREGAPPDHSKDLGSEAEPESVARKILLDQLAGRSCSRAELAKKLSQRNVPSDLANQLLDRFEELGLVNDAAFAASWVESRQRTKQLGRRVLAQELQRKGIAPGVIDQALAQVDHEAELSSARALIAKRLSSMQGLPRQTAYRRLVGLLARKGLSGDVAHQVVIESLGGDTVLPQNDSYAAPHE
jgi:regulatory protein